MPWRTERREGIVRLEGEKRLVEIPGDFVLAGDKIEIRQEKDGTISISPASREGWLALDKFNPLGDWDDDDVRDQ